MSRAGWMLKALLIWVAGAVAVILVGAVWYLDQKPDLKVWHTAWLDAEFTTSTPARTFDDYLALEDRLFKQLDELVYNRIDPEDRLPFNRYFRGSKTDSGSWSPDWNRSYVLSTERPAAGVLLIHGMSDSPYVLRALAERLNAGGAAVVGLRVPGHGTAPSGLVRVRYEDMAAAVKLAVERLRDEVGERPITIVGFSNGGALAVHYALAALEDPSLPAIERVFLMSPEIGVTPMAVLAIWQERIGRLLGLDKLNWNTILPEYDPYKYGSFAVNAGNQAYRLTIENRNRLERLGAAGKLDGFPPVLAFQSAVDATIVAPDLVKELFDQLPDRGHELVLFDINRTIEIEALLKEDPRAWIESITETPDKRYTFSLVTNENDKSEHMVVRSQKPGQSGSATTDIELTWPRSIYSLTHLALPIPANDPLYGGEDQGKSPGIRLGSLALRGERGVLVIPADDMLRLRWNPFFPYVEQRILALVLPGQVGTR
ncbi:MAG: alpha/beta fold hydrolase [Deltaproteobacteria bacterium]|nr:alpha/beta fold hydrolase [Deltaproteobacteria bacterium]